MTAGAGGDQIREGDDRDDSNDSISAATKLPALPVKLKGRLKAGRNAAGEVLKDRIRPSPVGLASREASSSSRLEARIAHHLANRVARTAR